MWSLPEKLAYIMAGLRRKLLYHKTFHFGSFQANSNNKIFWKKNIGLILTKTKQIRIFKKTFTVLILNIDFFLRYSQNQKKSNWLIRQTVESHTVGQTTTFSYDPMFHTQPKKTWPNTTKISLDISSYALIFNKLYITLTHLF